MMKFGITFGDMLKGWLVVKRSVRFVGILLPETLPLRGSNGISQE
jgi:hypothetical protein